MLKYLQDYIAACPATAAAAVPPITGPISKILCSISHLNTTQKPGKIWYIYFFTKMMSYSWSYLKSSVLTKTNNYELSLTVYIDDSICQPGLK